MPRLLDRDDAWYRERLAPPRRDAGRPLRVVIDTDAANEIDDPFALAWALLSPQALRVEAVYAAPFSFAHRRGEMLRARVARDHPEQASDDDRALLQHYGDQLAHFERQGWDVGTVELAPFAAPEVGMQKSLREIEAVFACLGLPRDGRALPGAPGYLASLDRPIASAATAHLIDCARAGPREQPLYVVALGCLTNIASALLLAPDIAERIVVVWTAGYPSHAPQPNFAFNLEQDLLASTLLFDSGVPHVYLPGYHVGAQLRLSFPEAERYLRGASAIGDHLFALYTHNPLWPLLGIDSFHAHSWVIWDVINIAWLLNPAWVPSDLVRAPWLRADRRWTRGDDTRHWMREAYAVQRDTIFAELFDQIARAP